MEDEIDVYGRMAIALDELEACRELADLIPEVRTNMVFALREARSIMEIAAIEGRITIIGGLPRACGRIRFGASSHMARFILTLMRTDPQRRAAIDFANPDGFSEWLGGFCRQQGWAISSIDRHEEPEDLQAQEGSSMSWKAATAVKAAGGTVPKIICDAGGQGKEPICIIVGTEPVSIARDLCMIAREYSHRN